MDHLKQIAARLPDHGVDAMLCSSQPGEYYAVGINGEGYALVAPAAARYITDSRYTEAAEEAVTGAEVLTVSKGRGYADLINEFTDAHSIKTLGVEEGYMTLAQYEGLKKALHARLIPAGKLLAGLRAAKDEEELSRMLAAQRITDDAFTEICGFIRPGMTEAEIAAKLTYEMLRRGAQRMSFDPIVASGPNGSRPHAIPGARQVQRGEFITMDFGCVYEGYCSDMTRTVALGEVDEDKRRVYDTVLQAQLAGIAASRAGVPGKDIDDAARAVIEAAGYGRFFGHGYGHSLGLEIHESPNANARETAPLPVGAMVSAEPGIYIPGQFGVRIEDVVRMEEGGCTDITRSPKELIIL
ncbi:aminopeptidase P family protein [Vermiculatibacterium agrestimuris]|uniref:aminopeptidase P family protein n=1 Tax=Vermiculatibacterium agrestimuris TaxID=2941519 RepID=UPI002040D31E|nr:aminopeptidase P family protein [Vermiculatibacterium agrestimuris]